MSIFFQPKKIEIYSRFSFLRLHTIMYAATAADPQKLQNAKPKSKRKFKLAKS